MDKYLVSAAVVLLFLECGWLLQDLHVIDLPGFHHSAPSGSGEILGRILQTKREVKRRAQSSLVWEETHNQQDLYAYDSILTLDQSAADVNLGQGTHVTLHENTLVSIEPPSDAAGEGPVRLHFQGGTLKASFDRTPQTVEAGDFLIEAGAKSEITIRSRGPDQFEVETHSGDAKIIDTKQGTKSQDLKSGQMIEIDAKKTSEVQNALDLNWINPPDGNRVYTHDPTAEVPLEWKGQAEQIVIEDPENKKSNAIPVSGANNSQTLNLPLGHYVIHLQNQKMSTFARNISIWDAPKIHLIQPVTRQRIKISTSVDLMWTPAAEVSQFVWQIATDENFIHIVAQGETSENMKSVENLPLGQYFWRVSGKDDQGFVIPALYFNNFYIVVNPLEAPKLIAPTVKPEDEGQFVPNPWLHHWWEWILPQAHGDELPTPRHVPKHYHALFQWEPVPGADSYDIEISNTSDFRNPSIKEVCKSSQFKWKDFHLGKYYWRVAAQTKAGDLGLFSETAVADLTTIPRGPVRPVSVEESQKLEAEKLAKLEAQKLKSKPTPAPTPMPTPVPTPSPTPELKPDQDRWVYNAKGGGHGVFSQFKGSDFTSTQLGANAGDFRISLAPPKSVSPWHFEAEYSQEVLKIANATAFPFQNTLTTPTFRFTMIKDSPYQWGKSWGLSVHDQNLIFKRGDLERLSVAFTPVAGPVLDWSSLHPRYENDFRLGLFVGLAPSLEGHLSHVFIFPLGEKLSFTITIEGKVTGGMTFDSSWWADGTGYLFLGGRW